MCFLEKGDGDVTFDEKEIVNETKLFYEQLYSSRDVTDVKIDTCVENAPKLNQEEKQNLEGSISYQEAHKTLRAMKNNKSPGSDGFSVEFYKFSLL